jgi:hypothetical protein
MNYSKWDQIADSDEEDESRQRVFESIQQERLDSRKELQADIDNWLRRTVNRLPRDDDPSSRKSTMPEFSSVPKVPPTPMRQITKSEREVLAMLIAVSHFEEGQTNLDRHREMLDLVRHHRWLEEDPGALELLCRCHNHAMKQGSEHGGSAKMHDDPEGHRMRSMTLSAINTLAAPKRAKCPGGMLELFTTICTPETEAARDLRLKWQKKEFGKDALFDSLFPDLRAYADDKMDDGLGSDFWIIVVLGLLAVVGIVAFVILYFHGTSLTSPPHSNVTAPKLPKASLAEQAAMAGATTTVWPATELAPGAPAPLPPVATACVDSSDSCREWAAIGECSKNAAFMLANCKLSCSACQVVAPPAPPPVVPRDERSAEL